MPPIAPVMNGGTPTSVTLAATASASGVTGPAIELNGTRPSRSPTPLRTRLTNNDAASCASSILVRPDGGAELPMLPDLSKTIITSAGVGAIGGLLSAAFTAATDE